MSINEICFSSIKELLDNIKKKNFSCEEIIKAHFEQINKYNFIFRHNVKPGITGLAQIKGYRGEIKTKEDIINRIKYDNFYIENWSLFLDIKIIFETATNMFRGQKEAY